MADGITSHLRLQRNGNQMLKRVWVDREVEERLTQVGEDSWDRKVGYLVR